MKTWKNSQNKKIRLHGKCRKKPQSAWSEILRIPTKLLTLIQLPGSSQVFRHVIQNILAYVGSVKVFLLERFRLLSVPADIRISFRTLSLIIKWPKSARLISEGAKPNLKFCHYWLLYALFSGNSGQTGRYGFKFAVIFDAINSTVTEVLPTRRAFFWAEHCKRYAMNYTSQQLLQVIHSLQSQRFLVPILLGNSGAEPEVDAVAPQNDDGAKSHGKSSMKTMNMVMPLMSAFFKFSISRWSWYLLDLCVVVRKRPVVIY